jgi:outer membrane protein TolC
MRRWALLACVLATGVPAAASAQTLSEAEAVRRAVETSPTLRAARLDEDAARAAIRIAEGARRPSMTASAEGYRTESLVAAPGGVTRQEQHGVALASSVAAQTHLGTQLGLGVTSSVGWRTANLNPSTTTLFSLGPNVATAFTVDLRQPLLRGAGEDATLGARRQAESTHDAARLEAEQAASALVRDVLVAHRELAYAESALEVSEAAVELAATQAEQARVREQLGTAPRTEALRYHSELAAARRSLRAAQAAVTTAAIGLGALLGLDRSAPLHAEIAPRDLSERARVEAQLEAAMARSAELRALAASVSAAEARVRTLADAEQPRLDLVAQLGMGVLYGADTLGTLALPDGRPSFSGTAGLEVELPFGATQARAELDQARAQLEAAEARYEARRIALAGEVAEQRALCDSAAERLALAEEAARIATELAEAERGAVALGTATALEVIAAQQSARAARLEVLRAEADLRESQARLAHLVGDLLQRFGVSVEVGR